MTQPTERPSCSVCGGYAILSGMCAEHYWQKNAESQVRYNKQHDEAMERAKARDAAKATGG